MLCPPSRLPLDEDQNRRDLIRQTGGGAGWFPGQTHTRAGPSKNGARPSTATEWLLPRCLCPERDHSGDLPLVPHLVDLGLKVLEILLDEVREAPLLEQVLAHGLARPALDDGLGLAVVAHDAVLDLVEREDTGLD